MDETTETKTPRKYNYTEKTGRPTSYDPKYCDEIIAFFDIEAYTVVPCKTSKEYFANGNVKKTSEETRLIPNKMPTLYRFAESIGVCRDTLHEWANAKDEKGDLIHKDFSDALKAVKELQKEFITTLGLANASPSPFAIFIAKNITDYKDKQEIETTVHDPIQIQIIQPNKPNNEKPLEQD